MLASSLTYLDARDNRLAGPADAHAPHLAALGRLKTLLLMSPGGGQPNPICASRGYRRGVFDAARSLLTLDGAVNGTVVDGDFVDGTVDGTVGGTVDGGGGGVGGEDVGGDVGGGSGGGGGVVGVGGGGVGDGGGGGLDSVPMDHEADFEAASGAEAGAGVKAAGVGAVLEQAPTPRFDAVADRFRSRRERMMRGGGGGRRADEEGSEASFGGVSMMSVGGAESEGWGDGWSEGGDGQMRKDVGVGGSWKGGARGALLHSEETAVVDGEATGGDSGGGGGGGGGRNGRGRGAAYGGHAAADAIEVSGVAGTLKDDVAEEHGLLSRLRSVAQEARLEVMDSRLQALHVSVGVSLAKAIFFYCKPCPILIIK